MWFHIRVIISYHRRTEIEGPQIRGIKHLKYNHYKTIINNEVPNFCIEGAEGWEQQSTVTVMHVSPKKLKKDLLTTVDNIQGRLDRNLDRAVSGGWYVLVIMEVDKLSYQRKPSEKKPKRN